jgi:hypothetical protein
MVRRPDGDKNSVEAWQMATAAEATMAAVVTPISNTAATLTATQSVANGGPVGDDGSAAIAMQ